MLYPKSAALGGVYTEDASDNYNFPQDQGQLTVQRNSNLIFLWVHDPMQTDLVTDIRNFVSLVRCLLLDRQRGIMAPFGVWRVVYHFIQFSPENLHDAVRISVIMDGRAFLRVPDQNQLLAC